MSAKRLVLVGLVALCLLSIVAPAASATTHTAAVYFKKVPCRINIVYVSGHDVVVDGNTIARTNGFWVCV